MFLFSSISSVLSLFGILDITELKDSAHVFPNRANKHFAAYGYFRNASI